VKPDEVTSTYLFQGCWARILDVDGTTSCYEYVTYTVDVAPLVPPFSYNNLCSSVLLTRFIPVYILVHTFHILLPVLQVCVFTTNDMSSFPKAIHAALSGVFWPGHWKSGKNIGNPATSSSREDAEPHLLLKSNRIICSDILNHLLVFCTFGMCSPFLALIMIVSVSLKHHMWVVFIGRFVHLRVMCYSGTCTGGGTGDDTGIDVNVYRRASDDQALVSLSAACLPIMEIVSGCVWPVVCSSGLFFSFVCWDVMGDEVGWKKALWAPAVVLGMCILLRVCVYSSGRNLYGDDDTGVDLQDQTIPDDNVPSGDTFNPVVFPSHFEMRGSVVVSGGSDDNS
jgi:hypothetical protein